MEKREIGWKNEKKEIKGKGWRKREKENTKLVLKCDQLQCLEQKEKEKKSVCRKIVVEKEKI